MPAIDWPRIFELRGSETRTASENDNASIQNIGRYSLVYVVALNESIATFAKINVRTSNVVRLR